MLNQTDPIWARETGVLPRELALSPCMCVCVCELCSIRGVAWGVLAWLCIGLLKAAWDHLYGGGEEVQKEERRLKDQKSSFFLSVRIFNFFPYFASVQTNEQNGITSVWSP